MLSSGEGRRVETEVALDPLAFGGQTYAPEPRQVPVALDAARTMSGWSLRLRFRARVEGPCVRCLDDADVSLTVDVREIDQPGGGEQMSSPYVDGVELDVRAWARDALALAMPLQVVCSEDCPGLCATCGANLKRVASDHAHAAGADPRWAGLDALRARLQ